MELLFLLLLPFLGALVGDGTSDDESTEDEPAASEHTASQSPDTPEERLADDENTAAEGKSAQDIPATLPGGDWSEVAASTGPAPEPVTVTDYDGTEERLILELDRDAMPHAALTELEASTDATTGDVILSLAGQKLATLAAPNAFDLAQVSLRAV